MTTAPPDANPGSLVPPTTRPLTHREFLRFQKLIHAESGIHLGEVKKALLVGRLIGRLRELGLASFSAYYDLVVEDPAERVTMLDRITTNETHFFREPRHFQFLESHVLPAIRRAGEAGEREKRIRVWSAACSTGQEPFTLAMVLLAFFPPESGWDLEVFATDLSTRVLERARSATWPIEKASEIPPHHLKAFMLRGVRSQSGFFRAGPELRQIVRFERLNLNHTDYGSIGRFDLVFCRNVLIYFDAKGKAAVTDRLIRHLAPGGVLVLGHAESLAGSNKRVRSIAAGMYTSLDAPPLSARVHAEAG